MGQLLLAIAERSTLTQQKGVTMRKVILILAVIFLSGFLYQNVLAAGPKKISKCKTITKPGSYVVTKNLKATAKTNGNCITIDADFVTLDLGGFTLTGLEGVPGNGVWDNETLHTNITIRNGMITRFHNGVSLIRTVGGTIADVISAHNTNNGINSGTSFAVTGNKMVENSWNGMYVKEGSLVTGNISSDNSSYGFYIDCPSNSIGNIATNNSTQFYYDGAGCLSTNNVP